MSGSWEAEPEILVRRYQWLLACYPPRHRAAHREEMLGVLLAAAPDGQRRPRISEAANLLWGALLIWLRPRPAEEPAVGGWSDALAAFSVAAPVAFLTWYAVVLGISSLGRYFFWSPVFLIGLAFDGLGLALPFVLFNLRRTGAFVCAAAALLIAIATVRYGAFPGGAAFAMPIFCYATLALALFGSPGPRRGWTVVSASGWLAIVAASAAAGFLQHAIPLERASSENPLYVHWNGLGLSQTAWLALSVVAAAILGLAITASAHRSMLSRRVLLLFAIPGYAWLVTLAWPDAANSLLVIPVTYIPPIVLGVLLVRAIRADRRAEPDADRPARA
jgi:hypothetical protein